MGRVALACGESDPEQFFEDMPDRVFRFWQSHYKVEPWGGERHLLAKIAHLLSVLVAMQGGDKDAVLATADLMPPDWIHQPEREPEQEASGWASVQAMLAKRYGG